MEILIGFIRLLISFLTDILKLLEKDEPEPVEEISISWVEDFIPVGRKNRPGHVMEPKWITIHNTGNSSPTANAKAHASYLKSDGAANAFVSWHFTVDSTDSAFQHLPLWESAFHAGDGNGSGNRNSIGIEICENSDGDIVKAEENTYKLVAWLLENVPSLLPFPECMKQHFNWSGKNCPWIIRKRPNGWQDFLSGIEKYKDTKVVRK